MKTLTVKDNLSKKFQGYLLVLGLTTSAFNIYPALLIPILIAMALLIYGLFTDPKSLNINIFKDIRLFFILFALINLIYAYLINIDLFSYYLYRWKFKFIIPFLYLLVFGSFVYHEYFYKTIKKTLLLITFMSLFWLLYGIFNPDFYDKSLYPFRDGKMWEYVSGQKIYLGPFMTHSAAGGFYSVLLLLLMGIFEKTKDLLRKSFPVILSILISFTCLILTDSRAFMLGTLIILFFIILRCFFKIIILKNQHKLFFLLLTTILFIFLLGKTFLDYKTTINNNINTILLSNKISNKKTNFNCRNCSTRINNIYTRLYFWRIALDDFNNSPFIGVGPSRFGDDPKIVAAIREDNIRNSIIKLNKDHPTPIFLKYPFFRVNIGNFYSPSDLHAHNIYINVLAEGGILIFIIFILMYYKLLCFIYFVSESTQYEYSGLAKGLFYSIICTAIASFFGNNLLTVIPMVTIFCVTSFMIGSSPKVAVTSLPEKPSS